MQLPPFAQVVTVQASLSRSQYCPSYPGGQSQRAPPSARTHVPWSSQGVCGQRGTGTHVPSFAGANPSWHSSEVCEETAHDDEMTANKSCHHLPKPDLRSFPAVRVLARLGTGHGRLENIRAAPFGTAF